MKIRLTKETLGLPVGTVLEVGGLYKDAGSTGTLYREEGGWSLWINDSRFEQIPEPTEEDRLREELSKVHAEIESYKIAQTLFQRRVERRDANIILLEGELSQAQARVKELEGAQKPPEPQYRMLEAGEIIRAGDEFINDVGLWEPVVSIGYAVSAIDWRYRRRVG